MLCMRERSREAENKNKDNLVSGQTSAEVDYNLMIEKENIMQ